MAPQGRPPTTVHVGRLWGAFPAPTWRKLFFFLQSRGARPTVARSHVIVITAHFAYSLGSPPRKAPWGGGHVRPSVVPGAGSVPGHALRGDRFAAVVNDHLSGGGNQRRRPRPWASSAPGRPSRGWAGPAPGPRRPLAERGPHPRAPGPAAQPARSRSSPTTTPVPYFSRLQLILGRATDKQGGEGIVRRTVRTTANWQASPSSTFFRASERQEPLQPAAVGDYGLDRTQRLGILLN